MQKWGLLSYCPYDVQSTKQFVKMCGALCLTQFVSFRSASENIPKADEIRTLVKDIWDTRIAKLRLSADSFISQQEAHAKVKLIIIVE